jgi:hypothetical protein
LWVCLFCCCCNQIFASWAVAEDRNIGTWRLYWPTASWERERWQFRVCWGLLVIILWPFSCSVFISLVITNWTKGGFFQYWIFNVPICYGYLTSFFEICISWQCGYWGCKCENSYQVVSIRTKVYNMNMLI